MTMRHEVAQTIRDVFNTPNRTEAECLLQQLVVYSERRAPDLARMVQKPCPDTLQVQTKPRKSWPSLNRPAT